ncbi:hypothetical protein HOY80DRAFT_1113703 [Tuber brumale]|nr:hypothetical protein HOY80DRAFT_1113703 [Tuber brumale]
MTTELKESLDLEALNQQLVDQILERVEALEVRPSSSLKSLTPLPAPKAAISLVHEVSCQHLQDIEAREQTSERCEEAVETTSNQEEESKVVIISTTSVEEAVNVELSRLQFQNAALKMQLYASKLYTQKVSEMWAEISSVIPEVPSLPAPKLLPELPESSATKVLATLKNITGKQCFQPALRSCDQQYFLQFSILQDMITEDDTVKHFIPHALKHLCCFNYFHLLDFLYFPLLVNGDHSILIRVSFLTQTIEIFNSLQYSLHTLEIKKINHFLNQLHFVSCKAAQKENIIPVNTPAPSVPTWTVKKPPPKHPKQGKLSLDCAFFVMHTTSMLVRGEQLKYGQNDMPTIKSQIFRILHANMQHVTQYLNV